MAGVTIEVTTPDNRHYQDLTQPDGPYSIPIPLLKPGAVDVLFRKPGCNSDHEIRVTTAHNYLMYLHPSS